MQIVRAPNVSPLEIWNAVSDDAAPDELVAHHARAVVGPPRNLRILRTLPLAALMPKLTPRGPASFDCEGWDSQWEEAFEAWALPDWCSWPYPELSESCGPYSGWNYDTAKAFQKFTWNNDGKLGIDLRDGAEFGVAKNRARFLAACNGSSAGTGDIWMSVGYKLHGSWHYMKAKAPMSVGGPAGANRTVFYYSMTGSEWKTGYTKYYFDDMGEVLAPVHQFEGVEYRIYLEAEFEPESNQISPQAFSVGGAVKWPFKRQNMI